MLMMREWASHLKWEEDAFQNKTGSPKTEDQAFPHCDTLPGATWWRWIDRWCPRWDPGLGNGWASHRWRLHHPGTAATHAAERCPAPSGPAGSPVMGGSPSTWNLTADRSPLTKPPQNITDSLDQSCWRLLQKWEWKIHGRDSSETGIRHMCLAWCCSHLRPGWQFWCSLANTGWAEDTSSLFESCCHVREGVNSSSAAGLLPPHTKKQSQHYERERLCCHHQQNCSLAGAASFISHLLALNLHTSPWNWSIIFVVSSLDGMESFTWRYTVMIIS